MQPMQPSPTPNPFSNPVVMMFFVLGLILMIVGIFLFWPVLILGLLLLVFALVWPYMGGLQTPGGYYQQPAYQPYQYPQYQQPGYQQPAYQPPYAQPAQPAQPAPVQPTPQPTPAYAAPAAQPATPNCPRCGRPVTYVPQYQRWYCQAENVYPWG